MQEGVLHKLVNLHNGGFIPATVTIVGRREDRNYVSLMRPVIAVHHKLMSTRNKFQVVSVVKLFGYILSK